MELLLELRYAAGRSARHADVRVDVDPEDTVAALTEALTSDARRRGFAPPPAGVGLRRAGSGRPLDPADLVVDTGLVSGETVELVDTATAAPLPERTVPRAAPPPAAPPPPPPAVPRAMPPPDPPAPAAAPAPDRPVGPVTAELDLRHGQALPGDLRASDGLTLDVTAGPAVGRVVPLRHDVTVGRAAGCTIVVDDPTLSREHFALQVTSDRRVFVVPNPAATNGTVVSGEPLAEAREARPGDVIEAGSSVFAVRRGVAEETRRRDRLGQVPFNRVPYRRTVVWPQRLDPVPAPPDVPTTGRLSLAAALAPLAGAAVMVVIFDNYYFLCMALMSPFMLVFRHMSAKRGGKRRYRSDRAAYLENLDAATRTLDEALHRERLARLAAAPDLAELARQAMLHMPRLWERNRLAGDLLSLRLGLGDLESQVSLDIAGSGDPELRAEGQARLAHQRRVEDVPITVDLLDVGVAGLWGDPAQVASAGRALVAQAACLHSPEDLVIAAALGPAMTGPGGDAAGDWLKWLPHVRSTTSPLEGPHLATGAEASDALVANLLKVAADRTERLGSSPAAAAGRLWPRVLLVVDEAADPDRALLSQLLDVAPAYGIHALWLGGSELQVPRQCQAVVSCRGTGRTGRVRFTDPARPDREVELDGADPATARSIARSLAPLRDASATSQTTAIPRVVPLFDVLGLDGDHGAPPTPAAVVDRWSADRSDRGDRGDRLEVPIGMSAHGVLTLDLVEQGPHTLIGGTSGSGKSELLQSLVLSLAANHPPTRLNLLFVDYKGGASAASFRDLPHTVGYVTNLSGRLSLRALTSLRAELQRRMALMEGRAKDLREMLAVAPDEAPPSLVIVVDEFAALVKEIPDFVAGMVDIAQRGRSLGVHLVLATQRPTGVVNENILANTNLRIALRMLNPADSGNVVGSRDAADIPVPLRGRAYARTGPQTLVPFQCAWSGAPAVADQQVRAVGVRPFDGGDGAGAVLQPPVLDDPAGGEGGTAAGGTTQLDVLVSVCAEAARSLALPPARRPWVEPLPEVLPLDTVTSRVDGTVGTGGAHPGSPHPDPGRVAVLGLYDDPENQAQHVAAVDLEAAGGLVVFGTGGTGKTTLLRTVALGLARQGTVDEVRIYALDFASRSLDQLADLPHCGAVIAGDDVEATCRLLTLLDLEIDRRRDALSRARAENLGAYRHQTGSPGFPRILLLVDGYGGFHSTFDKSDRFRWLTRYQRIVSAGRQVGVHCVIANDRRIGMPPSLLSAIGARLALRTSTPEELAALGVPAKVARDAELPAGRGFLHGTTEVQVACVAGDPSARAQAQAIGHAAARLAAADPRRVPPIPALPDDAERDALPPATAALSAPLGPVDLGLGTATVDLDRQSMVVIGPPSSGRSTALATVARGLRASTGPGVELCALAGPASPLRHLDLWDDAAFGPDDQAGLVERLADGLVGDPGRAVRVVLFVDAAEDVDGPAVLRHLETVARHAAVRLVVACEAGTVTKAYTGWLSGLRRHRTALVLQPDSPAAVDVAAGVKPELRPGQELPAGRGIFVANRRWQLVQVARDPGPGEANQHPQGPEPQPVECSLL
jgi:DNA segregation ATPase FtsK/SpoIIIE, S-DNA-T family